MTKDHLALLQIIEEFKPPAISSLEAALNVISNHAAEIKRLINDNKALRERLNQIASLCDTEEQDKTPNL